MWRPSRTRERVAMLGRSRKLDPAFGNVRKDSLFELDLLEVERFSSGQVGLDWCWC
jgi:hypothetical protein